MPTRVSIIARVLSRVFETAFITRRRHSYSGRRTEFSPLHTIIQSKFINYYHYNNVQQH